MLQTNSCKLLDNLCIKSKSKKKNASSLHIDVLHFKCKLNRCCVSGIVSHLKSISLGERLVSPQYLLIHSLPKH